MGVVVDAKEESAASFYSRYGFVPVQGIDGLRQRLFLHMATIQQMF
jgi:hypothetical protein